MEDDLVTSLTRQVREEVIENYIMERRLIELQIEHLSAQAGETRDLAWIAGKRLARLSCLMVRPEMRDRLGKILGMQNGCFWSDCFEEKLTIPLLRVHGLTRLGRFRKLVLESYSRLCKWMNKYRGQYQDLTEECAAVNRNIDSFQKNFDLLAILNFLRNLDLQGIEKRKILGENFTAKEMAELDKNLYIKPVSVEKLDAPAPLELPGQLKAEGAICALAEEVYRLCTEEVNGFLK
jgi:hypothetical protein